MVTVGIDEVGRGCWAGPLVAAAVILNGPLIGVADSKVLSSQRRTQLAKTIKASADAVGIGWVAPSFVDMYGLTLSVQRAMQQALAAIKIPYDEIIIDGNYNYLPNESKARFIVKADTSVAAVSAASIVAKVARDDFMTLSAKAYPEYGFESHKGYGTTHHLLRLKQYGVCAIHRKSVKPVKSIVEAQRNLNDMKVSGSL